jgi:hypothetical protein
MLANKKSRGIPGNKDFIIKSPSLSIKLYQKKNLATLIVKQLSLEIFQKISEISVEFNSSGKIPFPLKFCLKIEISLLQQN